MGVDSAQNQSVEVHLMSRLRLILSILLGLVYFVFGLNGFLQFLPMPPLPVPASDFIGAMIHTGYLFPLVKGIEVFCGFLLLTGFWVPLALVLLAPISVNILLFHIFLAAEGAPMALAIVVTHLILGFLYRDRYSTLFQARG